jgi:hypothetical protein
MPMSVIQPTISASSAEVSTYSALMRQSGRRTQSHESVLLLRLRALILGGGAHSAHAWMVRHGEYMWWLCVFEQFRGGNALYLTLEWALRRVEVNSKQASPRNRSTDQSS